MYFDLRGVLFPNTMYVEPFFWSSVEIDEA